METYALSSYHSVGLKEWVEFLILMGLRSHWPLGIAPVVLLTDIVIFSALL